MQLLIKKNAQKIYKEEGGSFNQEYYNKLGKIAGKWVNVETKYLFSDQYNIEEENLRVFDNIIEKIKDDARKGKARCHWCGKISQCHYDITRKQFTIKECQHCNKSEYLTIFKPFDPLKYEKEKEKEKEKYSKQLTYVKKLINHPIKTKFIGEKSEKFINWGKDPFKFHNEFLIAIGNKNFKFYGSINDYNRGIIKLNPQGILGALGCIFSDANIGQESWEYTTDEFGEGNITKIQYRACVKTYTKLYSLGINIDKVYNYLIDAGF